MTRLQIMLRTAAAAGLALALASGCGSQSEQGSGQSEPSMGQSTGAERSPAESGTAAPPAAGTQAQAAAPEGAAAGADAQYPVAEPGSKPDATQGAQLYAQYCATCHGPKGEGNGPAAAGLPVKPANHADGAYMNGLSNDHLFQVIKYGGMAVGKSPLMAPWGGTLSDQQIWDLVAYVRSLAKPPYPGTVP